MSDKFQNKYRIPSFRLENWNYGNHASPRYVVRNPKTWHQSSVVSNLPSPYYARQNGHPDFAWQPRFHDHIIRNKQSFGRIQNYIANNPQDDNVRVLIYFNSTSS